MKERPILFSAPMVRALLAGTKTQTRRVAKPQPAVGQGMVNAAYCGHRNLWLRDGPCNVDDPAKEWRCPYGQPGDRLWVRETFVGCTPEGYEYRADCPDPDGIRWNPSIHMPRAASRITLEVTGVRVERLNDISDADAAAEGWPGFDETSSDSMAWYSELWDQINGPGAWLKNPWVWVVEFRRITKDTP